jgi:hypothetical protein
MNATVSFPVLATQPRAHHSFPWRVFGVLLLAALFGTVTLLPYGWLYWRRGLISAMVAHFATDVVPHGLTPALLAGA